MKTKIFAIALSGMATMAVSARQLSADEALSRAFSGTSVLSDVSAKQYKLQSRVQAPETSVAQVYLFAADDASYIIAPADDCAPAVLGYGDNFDAENIPENMQWWLDSYAAQIAYMAENSITSAPLATTHPAIAKLMSTTWNQSTPYNNQCPLDGSSRSVTGCVATATAQVINYHRLPATKGTGTYSYTWNGQTLSFNYGNTTFDWNNMLDNYVSGKYNTTQSKAVATLMYAAGVGVQMGYSSSSSGALTLNIPRLLFENMQFDKGIKYMQRDWFTADQWDEMVYAELAAGRPVIYGGQSTAGGHCFVCDGYDGSGYYHINWGWGGTSDGSYLLSALDPYTQGIGGSGNNTGFNTAQDAIIGVQAPVEGSVIQLPLYATGGFAYSTQYGAFWFGQTSSGDNNAYFNYSPLAASFYQGLKLVDNTGKETYLKGARKDLRGVEGGSIGGAVLFNVVFPTDLPAGSYKAYPVVQAIGTDTWQPLYVPASMAQYVPITVNSAGGVGIAGATPATKFVTVTKIEQTTNIIPGGDGVMYVTFKNATSSSINDSFNFELENVETGDTYTHGTYTGITIAANTTIRYNLGNLNYPVGKYRVRAVNASINQYVSPEYILYLGVRPTSVSASQTQVTLEAGSETTVSATVLPTNAFDRNVTWSSSNPDVATVDSTGKITAVAQGTAIITATTINELKANVAVTVSASSGIEEVDADVNAPVEYFNLQGIRVDTPVEGNIYLRRQGSKVEKVIK